METLKNEPMALEDNIRLNISISPYNLERLKYWAAISGKTPSAFAAQIIASRIESNFENINQQLQDWANSKGVTVEELKQVLNREDSK